MKRTTGIPHVVLTEYLLPFRKPFATARQSHTSSRGILLTLSAGGLKGYGEANPRRFVTGERFEEVLEAAPAALARVATDLSDLAQASTNETREFITDLRRARAVGDRTFDHFPSLTLAIESALLDLQARAHRRPLYDLLNPGSEHCYSSNAFTANLLGKQDDEIRKRAKSVAGRQLLRTKLSGDWTVDEAIVETLLPAINEQAPETDVWFDLNESLKAAWHDYLSRLVSTATAAGYQGRIVIEQPTAREQVTQLRDIVDFLREKGHSNWTVMADESVVRMPDIDRICTLNREHSSAIDVNIKPQKTGSLLEAIDMAQRLHEADRETRVYFGGIIGSTDLSGWATFHLNHAAQNTGYSTAVRKRNYRRQLCTTPLIDPRDPCPCRDMVGLGSDVDQRALSAVTVKVIEPAVPVRAHRRAGRHLRRTADRALGAARRRMLTDRRNQGSATPSLSEGIGLNTYSIALPPVDKRAMDSFLLQAAALRCGLPSRRSRELRFTTRLGDERLTFHWTAATLQNESLPALESLLAEQRDPSYPLAAQLRDKEAFRQLLRERGLPFIPGFAANADDLDSALRQAVDLGYPVVLKPAVGTGGVGVTTGIRSRSELNRAWEALHGNRKAMSRNEGVFIVERHIDGLDARAYLVRDTLVGFSARQPAQLVGDGTSTATQLLRQANESRRSNPHLRDRPMRMNQAAKQGLASAGLSPSSVIPQGTTIRIASAGNYSQGGESVSLLSHVSEALNQQLAAAIPKLALTGIHQCGLDLIFPNAHGNNLGSEFVICEANNSPALGSHQFPAYGVKVDVGVETLKAHARSLSVVLPQPVPMNDPINVDIYLRESTQRKWLQLVLSAEDCAVEHISEREEHGALVTTVRGRAFDIVALHAAVPASVNDDDYGSDPTATSNAPSDFDRRKPGAWVFVPIL